MRSFVSAALVAALSFPATAAYDFVLTPETASILPGGTFSLTMTFVSDGSPGDNISSTDHFLLGDPSRYFVDSIVLGGFTFQGFQPNANGFFGGFFNIPTMQGTFVYGTVTLTHNIASGNDPMVFELAPDPLGDIVDETLFSWVPTMDFGRTTITIIPEPATMALLSLGGLALIRRRRR